MAIHKKRAAVSNSTPIPSGELRLAVWTFQIYHLHLPQSDQLAITIEEGFGSLQITYSLFLNYLLV